MWLIHIQMPCKNSKLYQNYILSEINSRQSIATSPYKARCDNISCLDNLMFRREPPHLLFSAGLFSSRPPRPHHTTRFNILTSNPGIIRGSQVFYQILICANFVLTSGLRFFIVCLSQNFLWLGVSEQTKLIFIWTVLISPLCFKPLTELNSNNRNKRFFLGRQWSHQAWVHRDK